MYNPRRVFRALQAWSLQWSLLPTGVLGATCWASRTVTMDMRLSEREKRCTLAHELTRIERGPIPEGVDVENEIAVTAARKLIPAQDLIDAWSPDPRELAKRLFVDEPTLQIRWESLTDEERGHLLAWRELLPGP